MRRTWVGIGKRAGCTLRERHTDDAQIEEVGNVHAALLRLGRQDVDGVLADPSLLTPRPETAVRILQERLGDGTLEVLGEDSETPTPALASFEVGCLERLGKTEELETWILDALQKRMGGASVRIEPSRRPLRRAQVGLRGSRGYVRLPLGDDRRLDALDVPESIRENAALLRDLTRHAESAGRALDVTHQLVRFERLAHADALTELPNRRAFDDQLHRQVERSKRTGESYALAMLDLDHFHNTNDVLGYAGGDEVLRAVSRRLRDAFRDSDFVARWGGEEFVALLSPIEPGSLDRVLERVDRARLAVRRPIRLRTGGEYVQSLTGGLVASPDDGTDPQVLVALASRLCIKGKHDGRDRILKPGP